MLKFRQSCKICSYFFWFWAWLFFFLIIYSISREFSVNHMVQKLVDVIWMLCCPLRYRVPLLFTKPNSFPERWTHSRDRKKPGWVRNQCPQHIGKNPGTGKQLREQFALLLPRQPGPPPQSPPHPIPVCRVMETEWLSGNKLAFPNFGEITLREWQNLKFFNQIQDHNIRQMLSCWFSLTLWSLSKSCFVFSDFYASIDVRYQTICSSTGKASYKFEIRKSCVKKAHLSKHTSLF